MSPTGKAAYPWWLGPASIAGAALVWLIGLTWRTEWLRVRERDPELARGGCVFAAWHARMLPLTFTHRGRGITMLVSRHRDGEIIARVVEQLGFRTSRGSSTRGAEEATLGLLRRAREGGQIGVTPDGPRGPAGVVKSGVVFLASRAGKPVVPVSSAASRSWVMRSWDGFRVPWPFTRVIVGYGEPIHVPRDLDAPQTEAWRLRIEHAMDELTRDLAHRVGERS